MVETHCLKNIYPNNFKFCAAKKNYKKIYYKVHDNEIK